MRKKKEMERRQLREQYLERQQQELKPRLPKEVMEGNMVGQLAMELAGDEPADDLFMVLLSITQIGLGDTQFTVDMGNGKQEELDMSVVEPLYFLRPYYPRTMEIVRHLAALGHLRLAEQRANGCTYEMVVPPKGQRRQWMNEVLTKLEKFSSTSEMESVMGISGEQWKKSLMYITDELMATFTKEQQGKHDWISCYEAVGRWNGAIKLPAPEHLRGVADNFLVEVMICPACYNLPASDLVARVLRNVKVRVEEAA